MTQGYPGRDGGAEEEGQGWGESRRLMKSVIQSNNIYTNKICNELSCRTWYNEITCIYLSWTLNRGPWWGKIGPVLTIGEDIQQILLIGLRVVQKQLLVFFALQNGNTDNNQNFMFWESFDSILTIAPVIIIIIISRRMGNSSGYCTDLTRGAILEIGFPSHICGYLQISPQQRKEIRPHICHQFIGISRNFCPQQWNTSKAAIIMCR